MHKLQKSGTDILSYLLIGAFMLVFIQPLFAAEAPTVIPPPKIDNQKTTTKPQVAVFAGGCFWGVQAVFQRVRGVQKVVSGYAGGNKADARYEIVSSGRTEHAESVQITYDPAEVSYGELLQVYFSVAHDPTQLNRQGPDKGTQYRSAIFYTDQSQQAVANAYITQLNQSKVFRQDIVTAINPLKEFYPAEDYHQDYLTHNSTQPYIVFNDLPKLENLKKLFPSLYRGRPVSYK